VRVAGHWVTVMVTVMVTILPTLERGAFIFIFIFHIDVLEDGTMHCRPGMIFNVTSIFWRQHVTKH
jgi:hypothetical protein